MDISIRPVVLGDEPVLARLNSSVQSFHRERMPELFLAPSEEAVSAWFGEFLSRDSTVAWIAESETVPVGYVTAELRSAAPSPFHGLRQWYEVDQIGVLPEWQRKSICRALVQEVAVMARREQVSELRLSTWCFNTEAQGAFAHLGFSPSQLRMVATI